MEKLLSAHQPVYLPWLGFFHKIIVSDLFVIFDDVPYSKKMWYNRNYIGGPNNKILLSVPVKFKTSEQTKHKDILIDNSKNWQDDHWKSISLSYSSFKYFDNYKDELEKIYNTKWIRLIDLNISIIALILKYLKIQTKIVRASSYNFKKKKSELILEMCKELKFKNYLFGELGENYCDKGQFLKNQITPFFQKYNHPIYDLNKKRKFEKNLCILDLIFSHGSESLNITTKDNYLKKDYFDNYKN